MNNLQVLQWLPSFLLPFFTLSYRVPPPANPDSFPHSLYYSTGILDLCLIISCITVMAVLRDLTRIYLTEPFAKWTLTRDWQRLQSRSAKLNGVPNDSSSLAPNGTASHEHAPLTMSKRDARRIHRCTLRFAEQSWSFIYYLTIYTFGVYVHYNLPTRVLNPIDLWLNYPHVPLAGTVKLYYLIQAAYFFHQVLLLNAEARRKDHYQMMAHHVISVSLILLSYAYNWTRVGCVVLVLMDCSDIFLPLAKMLRYIGLYTLCDATFAVFLFSWFITRHVLFIAIIKSIWVDAVRVLPNMLTLERGNYVAPLVFTSLFGLLVLLQILQIIWFGMICRVAYRVVIGQGASDVRSDEDGRPDEGKDE